MNIIPVSPQPNRPYSEIAKEVFAEFDRRLDKVLNEELNDAESGEVKNALEKKRVALRASLNYYRRFQPVTTGANFGI